VSKTEGEKLMRRASTCVAILGLLVFALTGVASAAPTVTLKGEAIKIPGFPHTGDILGAGADVEFEVKVSGTEYGGFPPPVMGFNAYFPKGTKINPKPFATCSTKLVVEELTPEKCPKASIVAKGYAEGFVVFGSERVPETVSLESFNAPDYGVNTFIAGHDPASIEKASTAKYVNLNGAGGYGPEVKAQVPLIQTVPGAPDASTKRVVLKGGAAIKKHGKPVYYGTMPKTCPKGGYPVKVEIIFAENGLESSPLPVTANYKVPCPRK
jgi:hypothetical protein